MKRGGAYLRKVPVQSVEQGWWNLPAIGPFGLVFSDGHDFSNYLLGVEFGNISKMRIR